MVFLRKSLLDTHMQIFIMLRHSVAEISRFKFDDYRVIHTGASDLKLFMGRVCWWIPFTKDHYCGKGFQVMTSSCFYTWYIWEPNAGLQFNAFLQDQPRK